MHDRIVEDDLAQPLTRPSLSRPVCQTLGRAGLAATSVPQSSSGSSFDRAATWSSPHLSDKITRTSQMTCANQDASQSCRAPESAWGARQKCWALQIGAGQSQVLGVAQHSDDGRVGKLRIGAGQRTSRPSRRPCSEATRAAACRRGRMRQRPQRTARCRVRHAPPHALSPPAASAAYWPMAASCGWTGGVRAAKSSLAADALVRGKPYGPDGTGYPALKGR